ncbi:MAG: AbrB/MazE/SpoVT family DNA-binding domain-containing protein [Candidatus Moranbacteria bacterium]|nr:AbrB/MazE/SpoVT family DNA-binding domain-containing protein [Candidatus Moranbacteria bacterium]
MANKAKDEKDVRKLTKVGGKSISVTLPIDIVRELGWKEKQKVVVKRVHGGVMIKDWKK